MNGIAAEIVDNEKRMLADDIKLEDAVKRQIENFFAYGFITAEVKRNAEVVL